MTTTTIPASVFSFLNDLSANNHRDWFLEHKTAYEASHQHMIAFADALLREMDQHDQIENTSGKKSLYRIYRDTRFSKDKTPYKNHWGGFLKRATAQLRGGYYFHIQPGHSFVGGGFWGPNKEDLLRIRQDIAQDASELQAIITAPDFVQTFGTLLGEGVKTAPRGFDPNHQAIDLIRKKQFIVKHAFSDAEVLSPDFVAQVAATFNHMRPFFDYMSAVLTTDVNGEPLA